jgi:hypothetical protein
MHPDLFEQHHIGEILANPPLDHLFDNRIRLALGPRLVRENRPLARPRRRYNPAIASAPNRNPTNRAAFPIKTTFTKNSPSPKLTLSHPPPLML